MSDPSRRARPLISSLRDAPARPGEALALAEAPGDELTSPGASSVGQRAGGTIENIQTLRALAALLVVFVHLDVFLRVLGVTPFGHGGVDLFFVISGFIMVYTTRGRAITPAAFIVNRITRIAPIYWLITLAVYLVALLAPSLLQATSSDGAELAKSLLFIPFRKANGLVQPVLFVGWTLNYELFFYALFAIGLGLSVRTLGLWLVTGLLGTLVLLGLLIRPEGVLGSFYTRPIVLEFAFGMGLAALGTRWHCQTPGGRRCWLTLAGLGLLGVALIPLVLPDVSRVLTQGLPAVAVTAAAVILHQSGVSVSRRWLVVLGDASYSIYLTHPFVTQAAQKAGKWLGLNRPLACALILLTLALVCVVGVLTHYLVERPLTKLSKRAATALLASWQKPAQTPHYVSGD
jgi:exopolysaccharide production protein ExoZ